MKIIITDSQAQLIADALELQSRLLAGQLQELENLFILKNYDREAMDYILHQLKILLFPELSKNEGYGIGSKKVDKRIIESYDVYKQIKHQLRKNDKEWSVHKDPHLLCKEENKIEVL